MDDGPKSMSITEIKNTIKNMLFEWKLAETTQEGDLKLYDVIGRFLKNLKKKIIKEYDDD